LAVKTQPSNPTQLCAISHGSGTSGDEDVTDVQVSCSVTAFSVGGTVTGLVAATGLVIQDHDGDDLAARSRCRATAATSPRTVPLRSHRLNHGL
jgi:hypothetical protein